MPKREIKTDQNIKKSLCMKSINLKSIDFKLIDFMLSNRVQTFL